MAHATNNRHTDNWWLETIASAVTQDGSGVGTLNVTGGGGGTQYADGAARGTATGTIAMVDDGTNVQSMAGDASGNVKMVGNVAGAATDSGNPVKVGGIFNTTAPTYSSGQRAELQTNNRGSLAVELKNGATQLGYSTDNADAIGASGTADRLNVVSKNYVYNGSTYDRMRGDTTSGVYVGGAVASAATDTGNPVKVGGKYNVTKPTFTDGQRGDAQLGSRGAMVVQLASPDASSQIAASNSGADAAANSLVGLNVYSIGRVYNGSTFDLMRGNTTGGVFTNVAATPTVTTVSVTTSSTSVLASNAARKKLILSNVGANNIWINMAGGTALNTNMLLAPNQTIIDDTWVSTTAITAIAATGATNLSVTEFA